MRSRIKKSRERIEALRRALLSPAAEDIGGALAGLDEAVRCLEAVEQELRGGAGVGPDATQDVRQELMLLKNDLRISARLIANGRAFCRGWARMLGTGPAYDSGGQAAPVQTPGSLVLRG